MGLHRGHVHVQLPASGAGADALAPKASFGRDERRPPRRTLISPMLVYILAMGEACAMRAGGRWALAPSPPPSISVALALFYSLIED